MYCSLGRKQEIKTVSGGKPNIRGSLEFERNKYCIIRILVIIRYKSPVDTVMTLKIKMKCMSHCVDFA